MKLTAIVIVLGVAGCHAGATADRHQLAAFTIDGSDAAAYIDVASITSDAPFTITIETATGSAIVPGAIDPATHVATSPDLIAWSKGQPAVVTVETDAPAWIWAGLRRVPNEISLGEDCGCRVDRPTAR